MDQHQPQRDELYNLIEAACENRLSPEELARLEALLREHSWARSIYLQAMGMQGLLERFDFARDDGTQDDAARPGLSPTRLKREILRRPRSVSAMLAAVVVGVAVAVLGTITAPMYWRSRPTAPAAVETHRIAAWVSSTYEAKWVGDRPLNKALPVGRPLRLATGLVELSFRSGAKVVLTAPVEFEVTSDNSLALTKGALAARVPSPAIGFQVKTTSAVITDLGTEFGVRVDEDGASFTEVFEGRVKLDATHAIQDDNHTGVILQSGESAQAGSLGLSIVRNPTLSHVAQFTRRMPDRITVPSDTADGHYARVPGLAELQTGTSGPGDVKVNRIGAGGEFGGNKRIMAVYYFPLPKFTAEQASC